MLNQDLQKPTDRVKQNFLKGYSQEVVYRFNKLESWQELQDQGCDEKTIYKALNVSRTTLFRWKKLYKEEELAGLENVSRKPHKVRQSIQVDGGSEFMAEFEQGCKKRNISFLYCHQDLLSLMAA